MVQALIFAADCVIFSAIRSFARPMCRFYEIRRAFLGCFSLCFRRFFGFSFLDLMFLHYICRVLSILPCKMQRRSGWGYINMERRLLDALFFASRI